MDKKIFEEKMRHGTAVFPVSIHKMKYDSEQKNLFYPHWHKEFEIFLVTAGTIEFSVEDRVYLMKKGDVAFVNVNLLHSAKSGNDEECAFFAVDFSYELLESNIKSRFYLKYVEPVLDGRVKFHEFIPSDENNAITGFDSEMLVKYMNDIHECPEHDLSQNELMIRAHVMEMWTLLYENAAEKTALTKTQMRSLEKFKPVLKYIEDNYKYDIALADLASLIPMSEGQFCRSFKTVTGMTPVQYINKLRILMSCHALSETDQGISNIANDCGFANISYFNRVFLKTIGCTPKEYRKGSI